MKRMFRMTAAALALVLVAALALFTFSSCGKKLSGTYAGGDISMTFEGSRVTVRNSRYTGTATYSVKKEGQKTYFYITFDKDEYDFDMDERYPFEEGDGYIKIGGYRLDEGSSAEEK